MEQLNSLSCPPSMLVWSGGGYHSYWLLKETSSGEEELARAERVMERIAEGLDGDAVYDRSRILRVPGTLNHKQDEPRPVRLVHHDLGQRYTLDQLEKMTESFPKLEKDSEKGKTRGGKVPKDVLIAPVPKDKRNVTLASVAGSLRDRGLDEGTITAVLLEVNRLRCAPPLSEVETKGIARSVSRYPAGTPRYRRSSANRVYSNGEAR
ncbi:MAG: primase alpha helix C-terminal domain-containing protein [Chloroflexota bacterium]|nr:primase alpha helix C-terminal domain-containing protein [Chloroflexota bacterium]